MVVAVEVPLAQSSRRWRHRLQLLHRRPMTSKLGRRGRSQPVDVELAAAVESRSVATALVADGCRQPTIGRRRRRRRHGQRVPVAARQHGAAADRRLRLGRLGELAPEFARFVRCAGRGRGVGGGVVDERGERRASLRVVVVVRRRRVGRVDCDVREDSLARRRRRRRDDKRRRRRLVVTSVRLDVLAQRRRVRVGLVAAGVATVVRLVRRVNVRVLLAVGTVGETTLTADELATKRLLTCSKQFSSGVKAPSHHCN